MSSNDDSDLCSIGRAAKITGISSATLRMWERRYGRPVPVRLPSGPRRFTPDQVQWLKRVSEALARGHRASEAVLADAEALDRMLARDTEEAGTPDDVVRLVGLARAFRGRALADALHRAWADMGPRRCLFERIAPLVTELGRAWADGLIEIRHEHLASQHVEDVLRTLRTSVPAAPGGPVLVLSTLPGESHGLGLQMVAMLATLDGADVRVLGTETPLAEIVATAEETGARAVGIGVSLATGGPDTDRVLAELRTALPDGVRLLVGGSGARGVRRGPRHIDYVHDLEELSDWLRAFVAEHRGRS